MALFSAKLKESCFELGHIDHLNQLAGLSEDRQPVFIGGVAIVYALVKAFSIEQLDVSLGALREGLIYEILDSFGAFVAVHSSTANGALDKGG